MTKKAATTSKSATTTKSAPIKKGASRFPVLTPETLTKEQTKMLKSLLSGPRGGGDVTKASMNSALNRGPFNAWLRSPELGDRLQKVGEYIRFGSSMPQDLNEMAILITARYWTSQFEWFAHSALAIKAGLDPKIIDALAKKKRPSKMTEQQASVYEFCTQLHHKKKVSDGAYARAVECFGEQGVMDMIAASGYYTAVSMTLNVAKVPVPAGHKKPLK
jgi:4-carboxymuconolactone decarboxylase